MQNLSLHHLEKLLGPDDTQVLSKAIGGVAIYIPKDPASDHPLLSVLSLKTLRLLCVSYGGDWIMLPKHSTAKPRKTEIIKLLETGFSIRSIAFKTGVTQRWVEKIASEIRRAT